MPTPFDSDSSRIWPFLRRISVAAAWRNGLCALVAFAQLLPGITWAAEQCSARSGAQRTALVELYTSEGCDSCPPADQWLAQSSHAAGNASFIPLALHVDYWDSVGWQDRFASPVFTQRQRRLSGRTGSHIVYTPEVAVAGAELRDWRNPAAFQAALAGADRQPAGADIALSWAGTSPDQASLDARFRLAPGGPVPADTGAPAQAYLAVYENNLTSHVQAGENSGATLHHQFVVRQWLGPVPLTGGQARIAQRIAFRPESGPAAGTLGAVAFVENSQGEILQALALPACP